MYIIFFFCPWRILYKLYNEDFLFFLKEILGIKFHEFYFNVRYVMHTKILYYVKYIYIYMYIHYIIIISISVNHKIFKS